MFLPDPSETDTTEWRWNWPRVCNPSVGIIWPICLFSDHIIKIKVDLRLSQSQFLRLAKHKQKNVSTVDSARFFET